MAEHPCYPGTDRPILIGQVAHDGRDQRTGTVVVIWEEGEVTLELGWLAGSSRWAVPVEWLCIGPAPEPIELTIQPTREELRHLVAAITINDNGIGRLVHDAIPKDLLGELRAEIAEERQS